MPYHFTEAKTSIARGEEALGESLRKFILKPGFG